jgi:hypothetical protein
LSTSRHSQAAEALKRAGVTQHEMCTCTSRPPLGCMQYCTRAPHIPCDCIVYRIHKHCRASTANATSRSTNHHMTRKHQQGSKLFERYLLAVYFLKANRVHHRHAACQQFRGCVFGHEIDHNFLINHVYSTFLFPKRLPALPESI